MPKENDSKPSPQVSTSNNSVNIILVLAIVAVLLCSQHIKDRVLEVSLGIERLSAPLNSDPISLDTPGKNPMCPNAVNDYDSCLEKLQRCKDTEVEFKKAEQGKTLII